MLLDVVLQRLEQALVGLVSAFEHDEGLGLDEAVLVLLADHGRFEHRLVGDERRLHFERRYPVAADLEHVVGSAAATIEPVLVANVFVARMGPLAREGTLALGALVPVAFGSRWPADHQFADFAGTELAPVFVDDLCLIAWHRFAGGAEADLAGPVADENVQHLGRADAVQDFGSHHLAPALAEIGRQRLAGGDA